MPLEYWKKDSSFRGDRPSGKSANVDRPSTMQVDRSINLYFQSHADAIASIPRLKGDRWEILDVDLRNPWQVCIQTMPPQGYREQFDNGVKPWAEFAATVRQRYGAINYAVVAIAQPASLLELEVPGV